MNEDSLIQEIRDSVMLSYSDHESIYKTILTEQHETYELIVYIWIAITAILISGTLFWNLYLANKKIESSIAREIGVLEVSLQKQQHDFKDEALKLIDEKIKQHNEDTQKFRDTIKSYIKQSNIKMEEKIKVLDEEKQADSHRGFVSMAYSNENYWTAVIQCYAAAKKYQKTGQPEMVAQMLKKMIECLNKEDCVKGYSKVLKNGSDLEIKLMDLMIESGIDSFSDYLQNDKIIIKNKLKEIKKTATNIKG